MNPSLYQVNTRVLLTSLGEGSTLDSIPDDFLDRIAQKGFDWVWFLGVWKVGPTGRTISRSHTAWHAEYRATLPDLTPEDISGSPFAICAYTVDPTLGGDAALARLRVRLKRRGLKLLLDFVPNHIGIDHPWSEIRPDFLIEGNLSDLRDHPDCWVRTKSGSIYAYGRDPNYPGWPDTLQLNYFNPLLRSAMIGELRSIATRCDGVRCDMAMLLEPEVFTRTWGHRRESTTAYESPFWPEAIRSVRRDHPHFLFVGEVYWGYEEKLQAHGFDYTYDKELYDKLIHTDPRGVLWRLSGQAAFRNRMTLFLENHDEKRIAAQLSTEQHQAAAAIALTLPGLRLLHDGQLEGKRVRIPVHLKRGPVELPDPKIVQLYEKLLPIINSEAVKRGRWHLLSCVEAWSGNPTHQNFISALIAHESQTLLIAANYAPYRGQTYLRFPDTIILPLKTHLVDLLSPARYDREGCDIKERGLFLDVDGFTTHIFSLTTGA